MREILMDIVDWVHFEAFALSIMCEMDVDMIVYAGCDEKFYEQDFKLGHYWRWQYLTDCQYYKLWDINSNVIPTLYY